MQFVDLLRLQKIDPQGVLILRHRPFEPRFAKVLPWLAAERPDYYNAYQQTQGERVEKAMGRSEYVASFIGHEPGKALFIGLYRVGAATPLSFEEYWRVPAYVEMKTLGMRGYTGEDGRESILWFELTLADFYADWKGKLVVGWPSPERSWWRWAHKNEFPVVAVHEDSALVEEMPEWDRIVLSWEELHVLPSRWRSALSYWRGIYFIRDMSDGKSYVGSAYGDSNLLGRWLGYASSGHGGNRLLRERDPQNFRFSILQRVSPDMNAADVIRIEATWKERLQTRGSYGLNDN